MKMLLLAFVMVAGLSMSADQANPSGEQQIIEYVADYFNVADTDVTLQSPNLLNVDQGLGSAPLQGQAAFQGCGTDCTRVTIEFPSTTLNFIVEDELEGI